MFEILAPVREFLREKEPARIDNIIFRLYSRLTVLLLSVCAILVTAKQLVGVPISCITNGSIETDPVNAYCWIYSTFTVKRHLRGIPGRQVAAPGVATAVDGDEILQHRYYQWVCLVLILQAAAFYAPRGIWRAWESGLAASLAHDLNSPFLGDSWTNERRSRLVGYFAGDDDSRRRGHNFYAIKFFICELFNFINAVGQIYLLDAFLEGQFRSYGPSILKAAFSGDESKRIDPMSRLFPKLAKCTLHTFGSAGSTQTHDALCVLPLNVVNEKIFVVVWFWLVFLCTLGAIAIVYRITVLTQPWIRVHLLRASASCLSRETAERLVIRDLSYGDWFVLRQLAKNSSPLVFRHLVLDLAHGLTKNNA